MSSNARDYSFMRPAGSGRRDCFAFSGPQYVANDTLILGS